MLKPILTSLCLLFSVLLQAQEVEEKSGVNAVYLGMGLASDFENGLSDVSVNLNLIFAKGWGVSVEAWLNARNGVKVPDDYAAGFNLNFFGPSKPQDYLESYTLLSTKQFFLGKNSGISLKFGPELAIQRVADNFSKIDGGGWSHNYVYNHEINQGWGVMLKVGLYGTAATWCGFQLELIGNFNEFRNYSAVCVTWNLGWMGKKK